MATPFENFVNTELPKRIGTNESPITPGAGDIPVFTGVGLLTESKTASEAGLATETFATNAANTAETNAKSYADDLIISIYKFQTTYNPQTTGNFPTTANTVGGVAIKKGFTWVVSGVTGQYTFQGVTVNNGDTIVALIDNPSATTSADWHITESNLGYTPENQNNKDTDGTLSANSDTKYPSQKAVKTYADTKQAALADVITADTYGSSTQYPVITFNAKGIATGVTLQTPTFTDATFSVQKNGSPAITATWSLSALTESRVHTYPDKDIDFKTLSSVGASDSNTLSGTRNRIVGGNGNHVSGTGNVLINCTGAILNNTSTSRTMIDSKWSIVGEPANVIAIGVKNYHLQTQPLSNTIVIGSANNEDLSTYPVAAATMVNSLFASSDSVPVSGTLYASLDGSQTLSAANCLQITGSGGTVQYEVDFIVSVGTVGLASTACNATGCIVMRRIFTVFRFDPFTAYISAVDTVGTDRKLGTIAGTFTPTIALSGATHVTVGITRAGGVAGQEAMAISARVRSHLTR